MDNASSHLQINLSNVKKYFFFTSQHHSGFPTTEPRSMDIIVQTVSLPPQSLSSDHEIQLDELDPNPRKFF